MKLLAGILLLSTAVLAQNKTAITGTWEGNATVRGQQVPVHLEISGSASSLTAALINGPEKSAASSITFDDNHLLVTFNYFARTLDAKLESGQLTGTFGTATTRYPVVLSTGNKPAAPSSSPAPTNISGDWEIQVKSAKGEAAWQLRIEPLGKSATMHAVIQRIDGDTGSLFGTWNGQNYTVSHFTAAGPALYTFTPQPDGTLTVSNLLAAEAQKAQQQNLTARRPAEARKQNLAAPTDSTQQTTVKDPNAPFIFSFPNLQGNLVSNTDPQFEGKVVIVAVGGSWCPNCHDEAPFLETPYKQYHPRGLEIVNLSFEEADQLKDPARLRAFIARYGITYTVLVAGEPDQLNEKIPQGVRLNSWPTSFFVGRDGRVKEVHAGFAGPANPEGHAALEREVTTLVENLLAEPAPTQSASTKH